MTNLETKKNFLFFIPLILVVSIFFISFVNAEDSIIISSKNIGNFKPNTPITLIQTCDNCTTVNITSIYSKSTSSFNLLTEAVMTKNGTVYSYVPTISLPQGDYAYCTKGDLDGAITTQCVDFSIGFGIMIPLILLIAGFCLLALGLYQKEYIIGFSSGFLLSIAGVYLLIYGLSSFNDLYTKTIAYVSLFLGLIVLLSSAYEAIPELQEKVEDD